MLRESGYIIAFVLLLFAVPLIPCAGIWWLLSPAGFIQTIITILACVVFYLPIWLVWLIVMIAIVER